MLVLTVQEDDITDSGGRGGVWYRTVLMVHVGAVLNCLSKSLGFLLLTLAGCLAGWLPWSAQFRL